MTVVMTPEKNKKQNTVSKSKLKPNLLAYLRDVQETHAPLIVTDHNLPVLQIIPYFPKQPPNILFKNEQGKVHYEKNVWEPETESWGDLA